MAKKRTKSSSKKSNDKTAWSPYLAGGLSGVVVILSVLIAGKFFGASTTFARTAGMIMSWFSDKIYNMEYFVKYVPQIEWQWMFVFGILLGALIASLMYKDFKWRSVPDMWRKRFGKSAPKRAVVAFVGGALMLFGARLAGGCPSGHGLSGTLQLSVSGYIALVCFFIGGIIVAHLLYRGGGKK